MLDALGQYLIFLLETVTLVVAILVIVAGVVGIASKGKDKGKSRIKIKNLNKKFDNVAEKLRDEVFSKAELKEYRKHEKQKKKALHKKSEQKDQFKVFVIKFNGDLKASAVESLREEVTAVISVATPKDEVVILLESPGGMVPNYGLAASQLARIRERAIPLTIAVDKVAASGGYLMACVGDKILAAPFAYIGSIGVVAQIPNFNKLLKKNNIDFEQVTAGEYKRTLSFFGENTEEARMKVKQDLEDIHTLFKDFITQNRDNLDISEVATGEYWTAHKAKELNLVDQLITSDAYLLSKHEEAKIFQITYQQKLPLSKKFAAAASMWFDKISLRFAGQHDDLTNI